MSQCSHLFLSPVYVFLIVHLLYYICGQPLLVHIVHHEKNSPPESAVVQHATQLWIGGARPLFLLILISCKPTLDLLITQTRPKI